MNLETPIEHRAAHAPPSVRIAPRAKTSEETSLVIRRAQITDKAALHEMLAELAHITGERRPLTQIDLVDLLKAPRPWMKLFVAERDGALIGLVTLAGGENLRFGQRQSEMAHLFVTKPARKTGVGTALIARARLTAMAQGASNLSASIGADQLSARIAVLKNGFRADQNSARRFSVALA